MLNPERQGAPQRLQSSLVSGHKADLGLMLLDPDPLLVDSVPQAIRASVLGPALVPTYSFVSITEVSEYVPTVEQYGERLRQDGTAETDPAYQAKINAYAQRLPAMNKQRLYPDFPPLPVFCFYPMNKIRDPAANWYQLPFSERSALMAEHATSGIKFAGRVSQLITASTGLRRLGMGRDALGPQRRRRSKRSSTRCGLTARRPAMPSSARSTWAT